MVGGLLEEREGLTLAQLMKGVLLLPSTKN